MKKIDVVPAGLKFRFVGNVPFGRTFRVLNLSAGGTAGRMKVENRSPISRAFRGRLGCGDGDLE